MLEYTDGWTQTQECSSTNQPSHPLSGSVRTQTQYSLKAQHASTHPAGSTFFFFLLLLLLLLSTARDPKGQDGTRRCALPEDGIEVNCANGK